jgi:hypothetical protein
MSEENNGLSRWRGPLDARNVGRVEGTKNRVTQNIRKAYQDLVEGNLDNMSQWIGHIANENPKEAMELMIKLSEFVIPKLARTELTGANGDDVFKNVTFQFGPDVNSDQRNQDTLPPSNIEDLD